MPVPTNSIAVLQNMHAKEMEEKRMKSTLLKEVDHYLFEYTLAALKKIYKEAVILNKSLFNYSFFTRALLSTQNPHGRTSSNIPSDKVIEFLAPHIERYAPMIKRRELIQCYLLQFMNQSNHFYEVMFLLPDGVYKHLAQRGTLVEPRELLSDKNPLIEIFKQKPEYEMIKQQEVFLSMGL